MRGETYLDTYAPAIPKTVSVHIAEYSPSILKDYQAVLGAAGYKAHEVYDPVWRHVHVPEQFLLMVCPMAEQIYDEIVGKLIYVFRSSCFDTSEFCRQEKPFWRRQLLVHGDDTSALRFPGLYFFFSGIDNETQTFYPGWGSDLSEMPKVRHISPPCARPQRRSKLDAKHIPERVKHTSSKCWKSH